MLIFLQQDADPHHMHTDFSYVYYFLILAVIITALILFAGIKFMNFLDNRYERKKELEKTLEAPGDSADKR